MARYISCSGHKIAREAMCWLGYLEHNDKHLLGIPRENVGKGGHTAFAEIVRQKCGRNLQGAPWCAVFVYAVYLLAIGQKETRRLLGRPHARAKNLARAVKWRGLWRNYIRDVRVGDIVFYTNGSGKIDHCGIIVETDGFQSFTAIEGNAVDDSGYFEKADGGSVALRRRHCCDSVIVGYGAITRRMKNGGI